MDDTTPFNSVISSVAEANPLLNISSRAENINYVVPSTIGDMRSDNTTSTDLDNAELNQSSILNIGTVQHAIIDSNDTTSLNIVIEPITSEILYQTESEETPTRPIELPLLDVKLTKRSPPELINAVLETYLLGYFPALTFNDTSAENSNIIVNNGPIINEMESLQIVDISSNNNINNNNNSV